jgi:hypothetical protein
MKITGVVVTAAMAVASVWADQSTTVQQATVIVCIDSDPHIPVGTLPLASEMFARIGVRIDWRERFCPVGVGAIVASYNSSDKQMPDALGFAAPYEGKNHIVVFYDRVHDHANELNPDRGLRLLLAHVLVHEITHVLEGISRHSPTGIMKARWDRHDYFAMSRKPLPFAQEDIDLIYHGLKPRQARLATAATASVSTGSVASQ